MRKRIAIIGSNGQLGHDLVEELSSTYTILPLTHKDIEIINPKSFNKLKRFKPSIVITTAAYTRVDEAESSPNKAFSVNSIGTKHLAEYCREAKATLVFFSTDYVFGQDRKRKKPYTEDDLPGPLNTYGVSKLAGEEYIKGILTNYFIIRTTGLFGIAGSSGKGYNFVELMLSLAKKQKVLTVVKDQISSPTYTKDLARQTRVLLETSDFGVYHVTSKGSCSWFEFAKEIFRLTNTPVTVRPATQKTWKTPAQRPHYSVLENAKLNKKNMSVMDHWEKALRNYLIEKGYLTS